jgi:hypothetical protein
MIEQQGGLESFQQQQQQGVPPKIMNTYKNL